MPDRASAWGSHRSTSPSTRAAGLSPRSPAAPRVVGSTDAAAATGSCGPRGSSGSSTVERPHQMHLWLEPHAGIGLDGVLHRRIRARTSPARAPGSATMKFACFVETCAPPTRWPFEAGGLDQSGRVVARGVLEHAAAVRLGEGLRSAPPIPGRVHLGTDRYRIARLERDGQPGDDRVLGQRRPPVGEPDVRDRLACARRAGGGPRPTSRRRPSNASCAPAFILTAPPTVAGIATPKARPARPCRSATPERAGSGIEPPGAQPVPVASGPAVPTAEPEHEPGEALVGDEEVRALADHDEREPARGEGRLRPRRDPDRTRARGRARPVPRCGTS